MSILARSVFACTFFVHFPYLVLFFLITGEAFDGNATFRFALVDPSNDTIVWNHSGGSLNNFYKCHFSGMAELSPQLFSYYSNLKLRVWFNDGVTDYSNLVVINLY